MRITDNFSSPVVATSMGFPASLVFARHNKVKVAKSHLCRFYVAHTCEVLRITQ